MPEDKKGNESNSKVSVSNEKDAATKEKVAVVETVEDKKVTDATTTPKAEVNVTGDNNNRKPTEITTLQDSWTAQEIATLAEARAKKAAEQATKAKAIAEANAQKEYEDAAKEVTVSNSDDKFTNKRAGEQIFRREMEEPEFWLTKEGLTPPRPVLTKEEEDAISSKVEVPADQTPQYNPQHILSPEYQGISNYEIGMGTVRNQLEEKLAKLKMDKDTSQKEIARLETDLAKIDTLYENYHIGMNVFRTAKGGRDKIKK